MKRILITGAGSGLGRALALHYAKTGARLALTDRSLATVEETLALVSREGGTGFSMPLDVTREEDFVAVRERMQQDWGGADLVINNAGVAASGSIEYTSLADWEWILNINLLGVARGCKVFTPVFKAQGSGQFINIASMAGIANPPSMIAYNVSKAGVISLSETLRVELAPNHIAVTVVCPAFFPTNLMNAARVQDPGTVGLVNKFMKRSGVTAESVAQQVANAAARKQFLLLTHKETRTQWLVKRISPESFFKLILKSTQNMRPKG